MRGHVRNKLCAKQSNIKTCNEEDWQQGSDWTIGQELPSLGNSWILLFAFRFFTIFLCNRNRVTQKKKEK
jgi:hypothetical protein